MDFQMALKTGESVLPSTLWHIRLNPAVSRKRCRGSGVSEAVSQKQCHGSGVTEQEIKLAALVPLRTRNEVSRHEGFSPQGYALATVVCLPPHTYTVESACGVPGVWVSVTLHKKM